MTCQNIRDQLLDKVLSSIQYYPLVGDTSNIFEQISNSKLRTWAQASNLVVGSCTVSTMQLGPKGIEGSRQALFDLAHTLVAQNVMAMKCDLSGIHLGSSNHSPPVPIIGASGAKMKNNQGQQFEKGKAAGKRKDCGVQAKRVQCNMTSAE